MKEILRKKKKINGNIQRVQQLGRKLLKEKNILILGKLDAQGWNNMFANISIIIWNNLAFRK
jgi:hypothetical protein